MAIEKLCKDCEHCDMNNGQSNFWKCKLSKIPNDLLTGEDQGFNYCRFERLETGKCGIEGKRWELYTCGI
jgi:hypothetical protein